MTTDDPIVRSTEDEKVAPGSGGSAERSLRLLQELAQTSRAMTLAELASALDMPKATTHRLCSRLLELGFLIRGIDKRYFSIGPALQRLAFDTLTHGPGGALRHKVLGDLVAQIGETCNFTTLDGMSVLYIDRVEAAHPWRLTLSVGAHVPLHCTASGKLFLSHMPPEARAALLSRLQLDALTDNTLTTADALEKDIGDTIARGYAIEREEFVAGLIALAVPVRDDEGVTRAAIAMHCPMSHVSMDEFLAKLPAIQAAAVKMGALL